MSAAAANRQKRSNIIAAPERPKRSRDNQKKDHSYGLWIDHKLLHKHMSSKARFLIPSDSAMAGNNYYLELADLVLNNIEIMPRRNFGINARQRKKA